jgi:hypothetical protein
MWKCPQPEKARLIGCLDFNEGNLCTRKTWISITYSQEPDSANVKKAEVFCERIKAILREI